MDEEFDINKVVTGVIESQAEGFLELVASSSRQMSQTLVLSWKAAFKGYVKDIASKHARARSFFHRSEPEYLYKFYVPLGAKTKQRTLKRIDAKPLFGPTPHVVIQGSGGSGKSVLTRHLLLDILRTKERIPVLIELRSLNQEVKPVLHLIAEALKDCGLDLGATVVENGIKKGRFALLFDGFDELNDEIRSDVAKEIRLLATIGPTGWILVTSRPDDMFAAWSEFTLYDASPLTLDQAIELVTKSPVDKELRERFVRDLKQTLFAKHTSFLSNPLLLSIMLLTYQDAADIPKKLSVFYSLAYEALFQRHDALKGAYKRQRKCDFDIHDFSRLFSAFSLVAYDRRLFTFSHTDAVALVKKASSLANLKVSPECFLDDCTQAVCLLVQDGLQIAYSHRSFQEYFAARFIADAPPLLKIKLLDRCGKTMAHDNVIQLLHEMQPAVVESSLVLPELDEFFPKVGMTSSSISRKSHLLFLKHCFRSIRVSKVDEIWATYHDNEPSGQRIMTLLWFVARNCSYLIGGEPPTTEKAIVSKFCHNLCGSKQELTFDTKDLSIEDPIVRFTYDNGVVFGVKVLQLGWKIRDEIHRRCNMGHRPLEEILSD
jgi:hypothetical protein